MATELHHYNNNAFAESIRYILHYTKQKFKDIRHDFDNGFVEDNKKPLSRGAVTLFKEGDRTLEDSLAIAKYVARGTDLLPNNAWDQAILESIVYAFHEYWPKLLEYMSELDINKKREMKKKFIEETIDYYFSKFEQRLKEHGGFFIGKLTWVEFVLCGLVEVSDLFLGIQLAEKYPLVAAVVEVIRNLPGVKEHIATRGPITYACE